MIDALLARHGLAGPASLLPAQGQGSDAFATPTHVIKIAHPATRAQVLTEVRVAPAARAAGVRTPALVAWAHGPDLAYSVWDRVDGPLLDERDDAAAWREVGRQLGKLHRIETLADPEGILVRPSKRDAGPYLAALPADQAEVLRRWLAICAAAPAAAPRLNHNDVHGLNVLGAGEGATLVDWGDAGWFDPAHELGSIPMLQLPHALAGYEEDASLGPAAEGRVLRADIGYAARKQVSGWATPMAQLIAWLRRGPALRFADWLPAHADRRRLTAGG